MPNEQKSEAENSTYRYCPSDASELIWGPIPNIPGYTGWVCPECGYWEF